MSILYTLSAVAVIVGVRVLIFCIWCDGNVRKHACSVDAVDLDVFYSAAGGGHIK